MAQIVLLAGLLLGLYGAAVLAGGRAAASRPAREHSRPYGVALCSMGVVLVVAGAAWLVSA